MRELPPAPLPAGFYFDLQPADAEVSSLLLSVGWDTMLPRVVAALRERYAVRGIPRWRVGVREAADEGALVGYGVLTLKDGMGELSNLAVHNSRRGRGIGKALVVERLRLGEAAGIKRFIIPGIAGTNTIAHFYPKLGFQALSTGELIRSPAEPFQA